MGVSVAVVGASGYGGGELLRLLGGHPEFQVRTAVAQRQAGRRVGDVHPQLAGMGELPLVGLDDADLAAVDLVFLALPHGQSAAVADRLADGSEGGPRIIDLGADFRLGDADHWRRWYGSDHAGTWVYGLPELPGAREAVSGARRVANPGCYATAITLAYAPLLLGGLVEAGPGDPVLSVVAASGVSGAGRSATERLLGAEVMGDLSVYKTGRAHQHIPEIEQSLGRLGGGSPRLSMTPVLAPMPRGILAVCSAPAAPEVDQGALDDAMRSAYAGERFVSVLPADRWPRTSAVLGSNSVHLQAVVEEETRRLVVVATLDNLGKGAAGQAIQNANLMCGFDEATGLPVDGVAP